MANFYASYPFEGGGGGGGSGTVTSVGLFDNSITPIYSITGSPVTTAGTLTFTLNTELANIVFAGPSSGGAAQPSFRSLVLADLPSQTQNAITALTGDGTASGPGSAAFTLATVNSNVSSFGSSTSIPSFTVNGKGLITAASGNVVIAPAGTLTGTTLNSTVVSSNLTSFGSSTAITTGAGGMNVTTRTITGNLTVDTTTTDYIIFCNQSTGITITLPAPSNGRQLVIKDISGTANTNNITIAQHASEQIEGIAASFVYSVNYGSLTLTSDGTNWWFI